MMEGGEVQRLPHNPNFENLEEAENAELRFFCEAFSIMDAVNNTDLHFRFATLVRLSKNGGIKWTDIPGLYPEDDTNANDSYIAALFRVGEVLNQIVRKGWITPMKTKSLNFIANEVCEHHKNKVAEDGNQNITRQVQHSKKTLYDAWYKTSCDLSELAAFQDKCMNYHADFQKENYAPHAAQAKIYAATAFIIFSSFVYTALF